MAGTLWKYPKQAVRRLADAAIGGLRFVPGAELEVRSRRCGFFGDVFMTLNGIRLAEQHGLRAKVVWDERSLYFDSQAGPNVWRYYFAADTFDFSGGDRARGIPIPYYPDANNFPAYPGLGVRESAARGIARWCVPRPEIQAAIDAAAGLLAPRHNLAMHVRLTDAAAGEESRNAVNLENFLAEGRAWLSRYPDGRIFLATDDTATVERFDGEFGNAVVRQDCIRSSDGRSIHGHYDAGTPGSNYRKGLEVIVDSWVMARCDYLVRLASRVTGFSLCLNPGLGFTDLEVKHLGFDRAPWLAASGPEHRA